MRKFRYLLLICCLAVLGVAAGHADSVTAYFNLTCPSGNCTPADNNPAGLVPVAPVGQVTFTLLGNGTIAASLDDYGPATVAGFGFDSCFCNLPESGWTPGTPDNFYGWGDSFGNQWSGFGSYVTYDVPLQESWIIDGNYTSVYQVLNGAYSTVNFYLTDSNGEWGAGSLVTTPEPGSLLLLGTGALGLIGVIRRKLAR